MQRQRTDGYVRKIEFVFYNESKIRAAVLDARNSPRPPCRNRSNISDPTAGTAMRNMALLRKVDIHGDELEWPEKWLKVVDATYMWCSHDKLIVTRDRYAGVDYRQTCAKLNISSRLYYYMLDSVRNHAALCAAQLGLIKVC